MLKQRTITSILMFMIFCIVLFGLPTLYFTIAGFLLMATAMYELGKMYKFTITEQSALIAFAAIIGFGTYFSDYDSSQVVRFISVITWCFIAPAILILQPKNFTKVSVFLLALTIFVPTFYSLFMLKGILGSWQLLSIFMIAWIADTGAYFVGKKFGKHKLAINISPGKTLEGALGGLLFVLIYLSVLKYYNLTIYLYSYFAVLKFGLILTTVCILGDLIESWFKRVANVKDSGKILPGHGGIFDRIDGLVAVIAIAFALIRGLI